MEFLVIESEKFFALIDTLLQRVDERYSMANEEEWISAAKAKALLGIKSDTSLQSLRNNGSIVFSQSPGGRVILYSRRSILAYISSNKKDKF